MLALVRRRPPRIPTLIDSAPTYHSDREIVSRHPEGVFDRANLAGVASQARRLAGALNALDVGPGDSETP